MADIVRSAEAQMSFDGGHIVGQTYPWEIGVDNRSPRTDRPPVSRRRPIVHGKGLHSLRSGPRPRPRSAVDGGTAPRLRAWPRSVADHGDRYRTARLLGRRCGHRHRCAEGCSWCPIPGFDAPHAGRSANERSLADSRDPGQGGGQGRVDLRFDRASRCCGRHCRTPDQHPFLSGRWRFRGGEHVERDRSSCGNTEPSGRSIA